MSKEHPLFSDTSLFWLCTRLSTQDGGRQLIRRCCMSQQPIVDPNVSMPDVIVLDCQNPTHVTPITCVHVNSSEERYGKRREFWISALFDTWGSSAEGASVLLLVFNQEHLDCLEGERTNDAPAWPLFQPLASKPVGKTRQARELALCAALDAAVLQPEPVVLTTDESTRLFQRAERMNTLLGMAPRLRGRIDGIGHLTMSVQLGNVYPVMAADTQMVLCVGPRQV